MSESSAQQLRLHPEEQFAEELRALWAHDQGPKPHNWALSPTAVLTYLMGGTLPDGTPISPKYIGQRRLMEIAVATLATDRALLLFGLPGTGKSYVSEHLAAAISGDSTLLVQGTAGTTEEALRYGWNYAQLIAKGPSREALVPSPLYRGMAAGQLVRIEELTRMPSDVQDALITLLSEKELPIPELNTSQHAQRGFNVIATANNLDRGIHELSSALKRRFNTVFLPLPETLDEEVEIVAKRVGEMGRSMELPQPEAPLDAVRKVVTIFRELRNGQTEDRKTKLNKPSGTLSAAEAIASLNNAMALSAWFGKEALAGEDLVAGFIGSVIRESDKDRPVWQEYLETVLNERPDYQALYQAAKAW